MSTYDDASLIYYPSGYKEDKIYSLKPTDGSGDLTFTRASSATRVNADGLIETASILGSELVVNGNFATDTNWTKGTGWTISGGVANANNVPNVQRLQGGTPSSVIGKTYKYSIDVSNVSGFYSFYIYGVYALPTVNTEGTIEGYVTATSTNGAIWIAGASAGGLISATIDNVSVKEVITNNIPRIDYTGGGCGKLLLEPQRTNLALYSEDFSNAYWTKSNSLITSNSIISPDGSLNASLLKGDGVGSFPRIQTNVSGGGQIAFSIFVKKQLSDTATIYLGGTGIGGGSETSSAYQYTFSTDSFLIISGGGVNSSESTSFGNDWVRLTLTYTTTTITNLRIYPKYASTSTDGLYIWGAQLEAGSYATSYIPTTSGVAVTRVVDAAYKTGISSLIGQTEGVLFVEMAALVNSGTIRVLSISDGTSQNRITIEYYSVPNYIVSRVTSGNVQGAFMVGSTFDQSLNSKFAVRYALNDCAIFINGIKVDFDLSVIMPISLNSLRFDDGSGGSKFEGKIRQLQLFKTALTDEELITLTTL